MPFAAPEMLFPTCAAAACHVMCYDRSFNHQACLPPLPVVFLCLYLLPFFVSLPRCRSVPLLEEQDVKVAGKFEVDQNNPSFKELAMLWGLWFAFRDERHA